MPQTHSSARFLLKTFIPRTTGAKKRRGFPPPSVMENQIFAAIPLVSYGSFPYLTGKNGHTIGMMISDTIKQIIVRPVPTFT